LAKKKIIRIFEIFFVVVGIQTLFSIYFSPNLVPFFLLVYLLNLVWDGEKEISLLLAFFSGLIYDTINKMIPGFSSIILLIIVYINSFFNVVSFLIRNLLIFVFSMIYFIILPLKIGEGFIWEVPVILKFSFVFAIMNVLIECIFYLFARTIKI